MNIAEKCLLIMEQSKLQSVQKNKQNKNNSSNYQVLRPLAADKNILLSIYCYKTHLQSSLQSAFKAYDIISHFEMEFFLHHQIGIVLIEFFLTLQPPPPSLSLSLSLSLPHPSIDRKLFWQNFFSFWQTFSADFEATKITNLSQMQEAELFRHRHATTGFDFFIFLCLTLQNKLFSFIRAFPPPTWCYYS